MFAVVKTGGKQYRVTPGDVVVVDKLLGNPGDKVKLDNVLIVSEEDKSLEIGAPLLGNNTVNCVILEQSRAEKILVFKKKRRKGYKRTKGHRQKHTVLRVIDINGKGASTQKVKPERNNVSDSNLTKQTATKSEVKQKERKAVSTKKKTSTKKKATVKKKAVVKKSTAKSKVSTRKSTTKK